MAHFLDDYRDDCKWEAECAAQNGEKREDGDDYRALCGTHFCQKSWESFPCVGKRRGMDAITFSVHQVTQLELFFKSGM